MEHCGHCQAELPNESLSFCPMCGTSHAPTARDSSFVPVLTGNEGQISGSRHHGGRRRTIPLTAQGMEALKGLALVPEPQPAPANSRGSRVPGTPVRIPLSPKPLRIVVGLVFVGLAVGMLILFLPDKVSAASLSDELRVAGNVGAVALLVFGLFIAIAGGLHRAQVETICRRCKTQVIGWKRPFGLQCPIDDHYARLNWPLVVFATVFWIVTVALATGLVYLVFS